MWFCIAPISAEFQQKAIKVNFPLRIDGAGVAERLNRADRVDRICTTSLGDHLVFEFRTYSSSNNFALAWLM